MQVCGYNKHMLHISVVFDHDLEFRAKQMFFAAFVFVKTLMLQQTVVNMRNRTQYLTVLQFDLCGVQGDKLDHYRKGAVPEQQMFPISYVKGCKNIHQYTPGTGELVLVSV